VKIFYSESFGIVIVDELSVNTSGSFIVTNLFNSLFDSVKVID
jgi:hypothetical protein